MPSPGVGTPQLAFHGFVVISGGFLKVSNRLADVPNEGNRLVLGEECAIATVTDRHRELKPSLGDVQPALITELGLFPVPAGARFEAVRLDAKARTRIVNSVARVLDEFYVFPDTSKKMAAVMQARDKRGDYKAIVDGEDFARTLTDELREVSHDQHLEVRFSFVVQPPELARRPADESSTVRKQLAATNCGFEKAEHLPPNVGYLKFQYVCRLRDLCVNGDCSVELSR